MEKEFYCSCSHDAWPAELQAGYICTCKDQRLKEFKVTATVELTVEACSENEALEKVDDILINDDNLGNYRINSIGE